jgi:uncharacterized protein YwgA
MTENDLQKQAAVMALIEALRRKGNWCGETHVQKTAYFVELLSNHRLGLSFVLYKHGPFSFELSELVALMGTLGYLSDEIANPRYGPRLKPNLEAAKMLKNRFGAVASELEKAVHFVVDHLADSGVVSLEKLGTALYFTRQEPIEDHQARAVRIHEVKPHISEIDALEAVQQVEKILNEWSLSQLV